MDPFDNRIGDMLISKKIITSEQLHQALNEQKMNPGQRLGHVLVRLGFVRYSTLLTMLSTHLHIPRAEAALADRKVIKQHLDDNKEEAKELPRTSIPTLDEGEDLPDDLDDKPSSMPINNLPLPDSSDLHLLPSGQGDEHQLVMMVSDLIATEDWSEAEELTLDALGSFPTSPQINWLTIYIYLASGQYKKALKHVEMIDPYLKSLLSIRVITAYTWAFNRKIQPALKLFRKLIEQPKPHLSWYFMLGFCFIETSNYSDASKVLKYFLKRTKNTDNRYARYARQKIQEHS